MRRIPRHTIDAIRENTDLVAVVSRFVKLTPTRREYKGLCPFHSEKSPSFHVVPSKGIYHCFGCQATGDVFRFMMELEGMTFGEAVKELAGPAGIELEEEKLTPEERRQIQQRATQFDALEAAAQLFESTLWTAPEGAPGRAYLRERGVGQEAARKFRIGFGPDAWQFLADKLERDGFNKRLLLDVGVVKEGRDNGVYDAFRNRLIFPIADDRGRVIGFGGRLLEGEGPKYLNTPETKLYDKGSTLYGWHMARQGIARVDRVILVEGYFDVIALHEAGFTEAVATCGTALTDRHLKKVERMTHNVVVLLDADEAGARAAERSLPMLVDAGMQALRLQLEGGKDPDELMREKGPEALQEALEHTEPLLEWVVDWKLRHLGGGALAREQLVTELLPVLSRVPGDLLSRVAARVRIDERSLRSRVVAERERAASAPSNGPELDGPPYDYIPEPVGWRPHRDLVHVLWLLVHRRDQVADLFGRADPSLIDDHVELQSVVARLYVGEPVASILNEIVDTGVRRTLAAVAAREELYEEADAATGMCQILHRLGEPQRAAQMAELGEQLRQARRDGNDEARLSVLGAQAKLRLHIRALEAALQRSNVEEYARLLDPSS